jgi:hypothetical protein
MSETIHYQTNLATIKHLHEQNTMLLEWDGFQSHENLTKAMNTAYDLICKENLSYWISDHRQLEVLTKENQQWVNEHFIPKLLGSSPIKRVAIIVGDKVFTNMGMDNIKKAADEANLPVQYFADLDDAFSWFKRWESVAA